MIELEDAKAYLRVTHDSDDVIIADLLAAAQEEVERRTGVYLGEETEYTETVRGAGTDRLYLTSEPVATISAQVIVEVTEQPYAGGTETEIDDGADDGFVIDGNALVRKGAYVWTRDYRYTVTYTRGYDEGTQPERFKQAVRFLLARWYVNRSSMTTGTVTAEMDNGLNAILGSNPVLA